MKYLINQYVTYDSFHGVLYASNDDNIIKLTTTLNRLLLILVQNNGAILAREDLLHRVWKEHNQVVSDNNLNSSISVLRRHLSCFFKEDIIITIPKVGVKFSVNEVLELPPTKNENSKLDLLMPYLESNKESSIENTKKRSEVYNEENKINPGVVIKNNIKIGKHFTEILLVVIIITIFIYVFKYYFFINRNEYPEIGQVDKCSIRFINDYHKLDTKKINLKILKDKISNLNLDCKKKATIFYYNIGVYTKTENNYLFISYCPDKYKGGEIISCENFYVK